MFDGFDIVGLGSDILAFNPSFNNGFSDFGFSTETQLSGVFRYGFSPESSTGSLGLDPSFHAVIDGGSEIEKTLLAR